MEQLFVYGHYGRQIVNGRSCLKAGDILARALKLAGLVPVKEASYAYFDCETDLRRLSKGRMQRIPTTTPTKIYDALQRETPPYLQDWIALVGG